MPTVSCSVVGCHNSTYQLNKWKREFCILHKSNNGRGQCVCDPPFKLLPFPTEKDMASRTEWIKNINRVEAVDRKVKGKNGQEVLRKKGDRWQPSSYDRICSEHFVDKIATKEHPYPVLHMGHQGTSLKKKARKSPVKRRYTPKKRVKLDFHQATAVNDTTLDELAFNLNDSQPCDTSTVHKDNDVVFHDHTYSLRCENKDCHCLCCLVQKKTIIQLIEKINALEEQVSALKSQNEKIVKDKKIKKTKAEEILDLCTNTDFQVKFYTGLPTKGHFNLINEFLYEKVKKMPYWRGRKNTLITKVRRFVQSPKKFGKKRTLTAKCELLLTLMKLRLGLLNKDIADRFGVSTSVVSSVFNTWVKVLSTSLRFLIHYPDKISVRENLPKQLANLYPRIRCILDCTEFFIDRPRDLHLQAVTWSDYKKHNTAKVLLGMTPRGSFSFVSDVWGGRASDRHITLNSDFLQLIDMGDQIMADKGFLIADELMLQRAELVLPPGARGHDQMSGKDIVKTKQIANLRIHVERAIQRLKGFRILKCQLPLTYLPVIDNIVFACSALWNIQEHLVK